MLPVPSAGDDMLADYASVGLTLGRHPLSLLRKQLSAQRCRRSRELLPLAHGTPVRLAGLVTLRQRPETASGATWPSGSGGCCWNHACWWWKAGWNRPKAYSI